MGNESIEGVLNDLTDTDSGSRAPNQNQWRQHLEASEGPFVVVNLLNIKDEAALNQYAATAVPAVQSLGAELIYMGRGGDALIGDTSDSCDVVSVWRWPSRQAWTDLWLDPDYAAIRPLFNQGVERYRCLVTKEISR